MSSDMKDTVDLGRIPDGEDVIDCALRDMYQLGIQLEQGKPGEHSGIVFKNKDEAKAAIQQLIKRETDKAHQEGYKKGYINAGIEAINGRD